MTLIKSKGCLVGVLDVFVVLAFRVVRGRRRLQQAEAEGQARTEAV
jgi:hypothetical protein